MKDCGGCVGFVKLKNDKFSGGLCTKLDCRTNQDHGSSCPHHSAIPYARDKKIKIISALMDQ